MEVTPIQPPPEGLLAAFLAARDSPESERLLAQLLETEAAPVITRVLRTKTGGGDEELADLTSATREELIARLIALRDGEDAAEIRNFGGYVASVAYNVWAQHLRTEKPGRAMLLNRVRYLLENRTAQRGFALWDGPAGERWCGLRSATTPSPGLSTTPKLQLLAVDPFAAAHNAFDGRDWRRMDLAELLAGLFRWLETPVELRHLLDALAELLEISDAKISLDAEPGAAGGIEFVDPAASAVDAAKWMEYLRWLWSEVGRLSLPQRTAFLLHSDVTLELDFRGVASLRQIAGALAIPTEAFATIWNQLPQDDATIAQRLQLQRQQVINLRRVARDRLGAAWRKWINR